MSLPKLAELPEKVKTKGHEPDNGFRGGPGWYQFMKEELGEEWIKIHNGPTTHSNWIIPDVLMMSAYPSKKKEEERCDIMKKLLDEKITVFVNLMEDDEMRRKRFDDYRITAKNLKSDLTDESFIWNFKIEDNDVSTMKDIQELVKIIHALIQKGDRILVHCYGGHGRTATVCCCFLAEYYPKMSLDEIWRRVQASHDCREVPGMMGGKYPEFVPQQIVQKRFVKKYFENCRSSEEDEGEVEGEK